MVDVNEVITALTELEDDNTVPKNVKSKIEEIRRELEKKGGDETLKINKALNQIENISEDSNIQAYTRTQIWNIVSLLEKP
jgi:uncharacterized protein (UPF0147 family)